MSKRTPKRYDSTTAATVYPDGYGQTIPTSPNFVPAYREVNTRPQPLEISSNEMQILQPMQGIPNQVMRSTPNYIPDDPIKQAQAHVIYARQLTLAAAMIVTAIVLIAFTSGWLGQSIGSAALAWLTLFGMATLAALLYARRQGLWNSSTGVAHHDIDARTEVAKYAIDAHTDLLRAKWGMEKDRNG